MKRESKAENAHMRYLVADSAAEVVMMGSRVRTHNALFLATRWAIRSIDWA